MENKKREKTFKYYGRRLIVSIHLHVADACSCVPLKKKTRLPEGVTYSLGRCNVASVVPWQVSSFPVSVSGVMKAAAL